PADDAPKVVKTTPANSATNVALNTSIVITFSESVNATSGAFKLQCPTTGSAQTFSQTASPSNSFTLTPTSNLPFSTVCTPTLIADQITDLATNDPSDQMSSNYTFSFTTAGATDAAPTVVTTTPVNYASHVPVNSKVVITFSESVSAAAGAFALN